MRVKVERAYTGSGSGSVWILSLRDGRGQVRTFRSRGSDSWDRKTATEALDVLGVELPEVSRRSIRFLVK